MIHLHLNLKVMRVKLIEDYDYNWYLVPVDMIDDFIYDMNNRVAARSIFFNRWEDYRVEKMIDVDLYIKEN